MQINVLQAFRGSIGPCYQSIAIYHGRYYLRGEVVYPYLRNHVFLDVQKFQKALQIIDASNPSGTSKYKNLNMPIAIYTKATKLMEYKFKDVDLSKWKFYESYYRLKKLPNF